ncbi:MAG: 4-hydroxy-tetrahydrodipicolinate synthase [Saprospiraceae bacterium]|nr:4-hydroxy-tetrahydrodipicolinate synthase [Saprospiraceae bacterium]
MQTLKGLGVALVTPFRNGEIDLDALGRVIDHTLEGGADFLVSLGTTGETSTLAWEECLEVLRFTIARTNGRRPVVTGLFAGNNTAAIRQRMSGFDFDGITALLSASPAYIKPPQEGIYQHYLTLAEASPVPVILYNVPGRTASNLSAETTLRLARSGHHIMGIKEASTNLMQGMQILKHRPESFRVWSGDDPSALSLLASGADGVISVIGNAFPSEFGEMIHAALEDDFARARYYNNLLLDLHRWMYIEGNPAGVKAALEIKGLCTREVRLPLVPLRDEYVEKLRSDILAAGLLSHA